MRRVTSKPRDIEGPIHRAILQALRFHCPDAVIHHSPNAIGRSGMSIMRQIKANTENGTVKGFPDLIVIDPRGVALIEVKAPKNYPDKDQRDLHEKLRGIGVPVAVVRSADGVQECLKEWGWLRNSSAELRAHIMPEAVGCMGHDAAASDQGEGEV